MANPSTENAPGGFAPVVQSMAELRSLQDAQAAHAFTVRVESLARQHPDVRKLVDSLRVAESRIAELEAEKAANAEKLKGKTK